MHKIYMFFLFLLNSNLYSMDTPDDMSVVSSAMENTVIESEAHSSAGDCIPAWHNLLDLEDMSRVETLYISRNEALKYGDYRNAVQFTMWIVEIAKKSAYEIPQQDKDQLQSKILEYVHRGMYDTGGLMINIMQRSSMQRSGSENLYYSTICSAADLSYSDIYNQVESLQEQQEGLYSKFLYTPESPEKEEYRIKEVKIAALSWMESCMESAVLAPYERCELKEVLDLSEKEQKLHAAREAWFEKRKTIEWRCPKRGQ